MTTPRCFPCLLILFLFGCGDQVRTSLRPALAPRKASPTRPRIDVNRVKPNEVGLIPVVMYHDIGGPGAGRGGRFDSRGLNIRPATFRKHLRQMREAGWYPVNLRDALNPSLDVPAGKTPVVITFDDARASQFRYLPDGALDPDCALGILEEFNRRYGDDWPLRATFFVMPGSKWNPAPFHQSRYAARKVRYLLVRGFEVANHSTTHRSMAKMGARAIQWEIAESIRGIRELAPIATMDTLALPYGEEPKDKDLSSLLIKGSDRGTNYENQCAAIAWGGPTYPTLHKKFSRHTVTRIGVEPGSLERWIIRLKRGKALEAYVSDGDERFVSIPRTARKWINEKALGTIRLYVWNDLPAPKVQKIARKVSPRKPTP